jgi:predicted RNA binding protein YcfA (HicA-like mRNA interferase family)
MPPLPVVSGNDVVKAFEKDGWVFDRQRGSHMIFLKVGRVFPLTIPNHREIDRGTLKAIIRQAGTTVEEFCKLLND